LSLFVLQEFESLEPELALQEFELQGLALRARFQTAEPQWPGRESAALHRPALESAAMPPGNWPQQSPPRPHASIVAAAFLRYPTSPVLILSDESCAVKVYQHSPN
jgi:hypothetical protein